MQQQQTTTLLTGATGFLGTAVVPRLLKAKPCKVYAIVRAADAKQLEKRRQNFLAKLPDCIDERRIVFLNGDLSKPQLGLSMADLDLVYKNVNAIMHMAASTRFDLTREQAKKINIDGGREITNLAWALQKEGNFDRLDYVSTCYVAGYRQGRVYETECNEGQEFRNSYEWSKAQAETHLRLQIKNGLRAAIHRPSIIVGDSENGKAASFSALYIPIMIYHRGWWRTLPGNADTMLDLVPVNYVADAMIKLSEQEETLGQTFHLAAGDEAITIADVVTRLNSVVDTPPVRYVNPHLWRKYIHRLMIPFFSLTKGGRATRRVIETFLPYFTYNPQFDTAVANKYLGDLRPPSALDYIETVLRYAIDKDFEGA
ncbi:MAG: SDR family oxidoreductase [Anaerolineae bacterium]